jgi:hypothetical protein
MKEFSLSFKGSSIETIAVLLEKDAPKTCEVFWNALPIEHEAVHASWSGECILVVPCGADATGIKPGENETIFVGPGEIALFTPAQELLVFYGRGQPRWRSGPTPSTVFARITHGHEEFANECRKLVREGSKVLLVKRKE